MMINGAAGKWRECRAGSADLRIAGAVRVSDNGIRIRHIKLVADQRDPERRIQVIEENTSDVGHAIAVDIAQQGDPVALLVAATGCGKRFNPSHHDVLWPPDRLDTMDSSLPVPLRCQLAREADWIAYFGLSLPLIASDLGQACRV
jgi:antitoxin (DNA-binding transcriptional repressor) of toxin-antitoxin stability system